MKESLSTFVRTTARGLPRLPRLLYAGVAGAGPPQFGGISAHAQPRTSPTKRTKPKAAGTLCWAVRDCGDKPLQPLLNLLRATFMR